MTIPNASSCHAIVFIVSICIFPPFFSNGPAHWSQASPSCDRDRDVIRDNNHSKRIQSLFFWTHKPWLSVGPAWLTRKSSSRVIGDCQCDRCTGRPGSHATAHDRQNNDCFESSHGLKKTETFMSNVTGWSTSESQSESMVPGLHSMKPKHSGLQVAAVWLRVGNASDKMTIKFSTLWFACISWKLFQYNVLYNLKNSFIWHPIKGFGFQTPEQLL